MIAQRAPAKVNLLLHVGGTRPDGLHEICSLFAPIDLADELELEPLAADARDVVVCEGVEGANLVEVALAAFRASGADLPPLRVEVRKQIPVAAGLGGGSADAAAVLRAANELSARPLAMERLRAVAAGIGADVPSQLDPRPALVTGAGETVEPVDLPELALALVPASGLETAAVYAEADRLGSPRERLDPSAARALAASPVGELAAGLENDLEPAALSLRPELAARLEELGAAGALAARVTGSGPSVFGLFRDAEAAGSAASRVPGARVAIVLAE